MTQNRHGIEKESPNQNLIKIDYKSTTNTKATFYDIIFGFSKIGFLGSNRKQSEAIRQQVTSKLNTV